MVVSGTWGGPTLSLRMVDPATGASNAVRLHRVVIGDEPAMCDFDIDLDRKLRVCTGRKSGQGHIMDGGAGGSGPQARARDGRRGSVLRNELE